eukprot:195154_1
MSSCEPPKNWLHPGYSHPLMRSWQRESSLQKSDFMYPIFVCDEADSKQEIVSMPENYRWGINRLSELIDPLIKKGLSSVLIFGVLTDESDKNKSLQYNKDSIGSIALSNQSPVVLALKYLSKNYPTLLLVADVCLCAYTSHGHCGLLNKNGYIDNKASIKQIANVALHYAKAGAHIVAPSDMMDGRIKQIKYVLHENNLSYKCSVMSYSSKYCSNFYGPFRDACHSAPSSSDNKENEIICNMKDRSSYQLPIVSRGLGIRASQRCYNEGADFLMIKPGLPYLDIIRDVKNNIPNIPIAVYQVSGEYAMIWHGAKNGAFDLKDIVLETCQCFKRAGAQIIITYYTPRLLDWINDNKL